MIEVLAILLALLSLIRWMPYLKVQMASDALIVFVIAIPYFFNFGLLGLVMLIPGLMAMMMQSYLLTPLRLNIWSWVGAAVFWATLFIGVISADSPRWDAPPPSEIWSEPASLLATLLICLTILSLVLWVGIQVAGPHDENRGGS